jgi:hypothetical protein
MLKMSSLLLCRYVGINWWMLNWSHTDKIGGQGIQNCKSSCVWGCMWWYFIFHEIVLTTLSAPMTSDIYQWRETVQILCDVFCIQPCGEFIGSTKWNWIQFVFIIMMMMIIIIIIIIIIESASSKQRYQCSRLLLILFFRSVRRLIVTANVVPSSPILVSPTPLQNIRSYKTHTA